MNTKHFNGLNALILFAVLAILNGGCKEKLSPCDIPKTGDNYTLGDTAKSFIQHYVGANRVIFETLSGEEIPFNVTVNDKVGAYQFSAPCETDNSATQIVNGTSQLIEVKLFTEPELSKPVYISLYVSPPVDIPNAEENITLSYGPLFSNDFGNGDELFSYVINQSNPQVQFLDSLTLHGRTYHDVYEMVIQSVPPKIDVKYSKQEGIIYMRNASNSKEYFYKRKE